VLVWNTPRHEAVCSDVDHGRSGVAPRMLCGGEDPKSSEAWSLIRDCCLGGMGMGSGPFLDDSPIGHGRLSRRLVGPGDWGPILARPAALLVLDIDPVSSLGLAPCIWHQGALFHDVPIACTF